MAGTAHLQLGNYFTLVRSFFVSQNQLASGNNNLFDKKKLIKMSKLKVNLKLVVSIATCLATLVDCTSLTIASSSSLRKHQELYDTQEPDPFYEYLSPSELLEYEQQQEETSTERHGKVPGNVTQSAAESQGTNGLTEEAVIGTHEVVAPERPSPGGCGRHKVCTDREESRNMRIELVKRTILEKLKMNRPPAINVPRLSPSSPPVRKLFQTYGINANRVEPEDESDEIKNQKVISVARSPPFTHNQRPVPCCFFQFSTEEMEFEVQSAYLYFYVMPHRRPINQELITIDRYLPPTHPNQRPETLWYKFHRLSSRFRQRAGWEKVLVTGLVRDWMTEPQTNFGIDIVPRWNPGLVANGGNNTLPEYKPFLDIELVAGHRRRKRSSMDYLTCDANSDEGRCCLYDFHINFEDIGWSWIIFPTSYNARYCSGECTMLQIGAVGSKLQRHADLTQNKTMNCCVPQKMAPLSMLYYDNQSNIVFSNVPDMQIRRCNCL